MIQTLLEAHGLSKRFDGCLHSFEKGLFSSPQAFALLLTGLVGILGAAVCLRVGEPPARRAAKAAAVAIAGAFLAILCARLPFHRDASEDKRNSLSSISTASRSSRN